MQHVNCIVAMTPRRVIGNQQRMPWTLLSDTARFRKLTMGHPCILGWKTFMSIVEMLGRPLDGRDNIVLTRRAAAEVRRLGGIPMSSPEAALVFAKHEKAEPFIIGGAQIYERFMPRVTRLYLTLVYGDLAGDTYFPRLDTEDWTRVEGTLIPRDFHHPADTHETSFEILIRK